MGLSPIHLIIFAVIALLLFGTGRFSAMMVDVAKGVKDFKKSMAEEDNVEVRPVARLQSLPAEPAATLDREPVAERSAI